MTIDRVQFLNSMLGKPWKANASGPDEYDCWHGFKHVQEILFNRYAPPIDVPEEPTWPWMISMFKNHPELRNWREVAPGPMGLIQVCDGAAVLMARNSQPAHIGCWLEQERRVLHVDQRDGVVLQELLTVKASGWAKLRFFEQL